MMADAIEAVSLSLTDYSHESINALLDKIIDSQMADVLYKESPINFKDIGIIKDTFKKRLATMYHSRIEYPEIQKRETPHEQQNQENHVN